MLSLLERYLSQAEFSSYEDFQRNFRILVPENFNFAYDVVDVYAKTEPNRIAIVWCNEQGEQRTITFGELKTASDKIANYLTQVGVRKGDPVMLILKRRYEYWFCLLALHKLGAVAIPATHLLTARDIEHRNKAAEVKMIISVNDEHVMQHIDAAQPHSPTLRWKVALYGERPGWLGLMNVLDGISADFTRPSGEANTQNTDRMMLYFTSGTTGMPKMVDHDFTYPLGHILTAKYWQRVIPNGLHLTVADTGWAKASWGKIYGQWLAGTAIFVYDLDRFNAKRMLEIIAEYGVTTFCAPPTLYRFLIQEDIVSYKLDKLVHCTVAGEPLNPEVFNRFYEATGIKMSEGYGQTETTVAVGTYEWFEPKPGSMGKPSPGYDIDLLDEDGAPCPVGEQGQIVIRTDQRKPVGVFNGYFRDPVLTDFVWSDGIYYTGDVAWRDDDGYYWFVGRADDLIKTSGYRVSPFEVESALLEHPRVVECAVTGVPDEMRGQVIKATVVLTEPDISDEENLKHELQEHVKGVTAAYKYPRIIEIVRELPKTVSGKILRRVLRETPAPASAPPSPLPTTGAEEKTGEKG